MAESRSGLSRQTRQGGLQKSTEQLWCDGYVYNFDCDDGFWVHTYVRAHIMHSKFVWFVNNGFSDASDCKETACNAGDQGLIPGSGRSPGEGNGNPL